METLAKVREVLGRGRARAQQALAAQLGHDAALTPAPYQPPTPLTPLCVAVPAHRHVVGAGAQPTRQPQVQVVLCARGGLTGVGGEWEGRDQVETSKSIAHGRQRLCTDPAEQHPHLSPSTT